MFSKTSVLWAACIGVSLSLGVVGCSSNSDSSMSRRSDGTMRQDDIARRDGTAKPDSANRSEYVGGSSSSERNARTASERMGMGPVTPADKMFLVAASGSNKAEIAAAELALQKSNNQQVKTFAQQMITDHRMAEQRLQSLAKSKGVDIETAPPQDARSASYELGKLSGTQFDSQYFAVNHAAHMKTVAAFQHAAQNADDPDIRRFAQELLPTLQQHTQAAGQHAGHNSGGMGGGMNNR